MSAKKGDVSDADTDFIDYSSGEDLAEAPDGELEPASETEDPAGEAADLLSGADHSDISSGSDSDDSDGDSDGDSSGDDSDRGAQAGALSESDRLARGSVLPRKILVVNPGDRVTSGFMSEAEYARVIAVRAKQIADGLPSFAPYKATGVTTAADIALAEYWAHRSPLKIERCVGQTAAGERIVEIWTAQELGAPLNIPAAGSSN